MKKINLIERLLSYSHEKQSPQRFARYAAMLIMLLTLGVGQMWGDAFWPYAGFYEVYMTYSYSGNNSNYTFYSGDNNSSQSVDLGTLTADFKVNSLYLKCYKNTGDWSKYGNLCGGLMIYNTGSGDNEYQPTWTWTDKNTWSNDYQAHLWEISKTSCNKVIASYNSGASGSYTAKLAFKMWGSDDNGSDCGDIWWISNNSNNYKFNYKIAPPAISSFSVAESGYISGSGTSEDPYIMPYNGTLTLTVSGSKGRTDANSTIKYWKNSGDKQNSNVLTVTGITSTTKTSVVVHAQCINNSSSSLVGTESTKTVYYKSEAAYSVTVSAGAHGSVSPSGAQSNIGTLSGLSISATPSTGYNFGTWTISSGDGSFTSAATTASNKFKPTAASTITASFNAKTYTITLKKNGADCLSDGSATATYNSGSVTSATYPTYTDYRCDGYYTAASDGDLVLNTDGTLEADVEGYTDGSGNWTKDGDATLYAHWTYDVTNYDVVYGVGSSYTSLGSLSAYNNTTSAALGASPASVRSGHSVTFTASPNTGYVVEGWYTDAACSSGKHDAGETTYTASVTGDMNVYVKYVEKTWSVAFAAGTGGTVTTPAATPQTVGQVTGISIAATPATGYTFNTWTITSGSGSFTSAVTTNSNTFKPTANTTVTASFNETMSSLSTSCHYDAGDPSYAAPAVSGSASNVGYATTRTITATAAGTGYTFAGWTLTNCTRTDGGVATANPITIRSNGDGAAVSVVANYTEVLTTNWKVIGDNQSGSPFGDSYTYSSGKEMSKKTGHANEANAYRTIDVTKLPGSYYGFKVATAAGSSNHWGYGTGDGAYITFNRSASGTQKQVYNGDQHELKFVPDALGEYEFRVNYPGNKYVYVTFPTAYTVTFSRGTVDGASGTVTAEYSSVAFSTGTKVQSGKSVTFKAPAAKTGYTFQGWYTVNNGSGSTNRVSTEQNYITTITADKTLYACYTINNHAITHSDASHGSYTIKVGSAAAVSTNTTSDYGKTITLAATPATGYHFGSWSAYKTETPATTVTVTDNKFTMPDYAVTVGATFSPNTYRVQFHRNGASEATVYQNFTYDVAQNLTANTYTRTGYTFGGWATSKERADAGTVDYTDGQNVNNLTSTNDDTYHLYAKWNAKQCTINFDFDDEDDGYGDDTGATTSTTATYAAAMTSVTPPTAAEGYAFIGFYDAADGAGTQYYDSEGTSARAWDKNTLSPTTLYAYYKKAEITNLVAAPGVIAPGETITITPTIEPTPTGTTKVCYELQYSNGTPLPSQPTFTPGAGNAVSFPVPSASATYIIQATLAKGSSCPAAPGDVLSTRTTTFQVAGAHDVTVKYMCGDLTIQASEVLGEIRPLTWSDDITAPTITGYTFARWDAGDGVTIKDGSGEDKTTSTSSTIKIKAVYDGTLTAVYTKKRLIFFNNTLGWSNVYVYFYKNDSYWNKDNGTGASTSDTYTDTPYSEGLHGEMTQIEGTNIFYFDAEAAGVNASYINVAFTELDQHGYHYFAKTGDVKNKVIRRGDFSTTLPMFVPLEGIEPTEMNSKLADYYNKGYWMNYPENTGYTLHIYDSKTYGSGSSMQVIPFEFNGDKTMPMTVKVELNANREYGYEIHRADGNVYGNDSKVLKINDSGEEDPEGLTASQRGGIQTSVAGDYEFTLNYGEKGVDTYKYLIGVHYPVAANDYRIVYTDQTAWSKAAHTSGWYHPSRAIHKEEGSKDIVSFYVSKAGGANAGMKFQYASAINPSTGVVTWTDVPSGTIDLSGITESGVYNFHISQGASSISVEKIEPYTGNYYIRTDCAGNSKWENFRTSDHQMTYSDYAETNSGYSHYYAHWVTSGTNVKFCIANDYSQCITDTLSEDYGTVIANITAEGNDGAGTLNSESANIRFMWNQSTNKVSRAYIGGSTNISDRFLVLEGDSKMYDKDGSALNISGLNPNEANLIDDQNFVYEREIQVNTKARAKLTAKYNTNIQYFKGSEGAFAEETTIELLGGNASGKHTMRIVYDFKTNRLVTAYVPSGTIEDEIAINADLMIVREHQGAGQQLLFEEDGALTEVHTVYGVMRFNRWTLNNKETDGDHDPVGDPKSAYERGLYWISFPFDVNLSDVFGFGTYGTHWIIMEYDGAARAKEGYWADSKGFWKYVTNRTNKVLEAGKGYVLALDLDLMKYNDATFWTNNIEQVELFFPSSENVDNIKETNVEITVPEHECTINRHSQAEKDAGTDTDINKNRTVVDSHWNIIGVPSYANYGTTLKDGSDVTITWHANPESDNLPFLYEWNAVDNTYTPQTGTTYPFKSMHAYIVQYNGILKWTLASATPATPAPRRYEGALKDVEYRLELQQNEKKIDQTFVKLSNEENASAGFAFDEDLCKEYNANKANIYTFIEGYIPAAGNTLPMSEQTTVVPVGVKIATNGEYTFAMPEGTEGVGITLVDNETGIRTPLSALDYTVNLSAGTYNDRFVLEISPIHHMPTGIEEVSGERLEVSGARKLMIDGILYIVKDGKMFDARGARVQ